MGITAKQFLATLDAEFKANPKGGSKYFQALGYGSSSAAHCCAGISAMFKKLGANVVGINTVQLKSALLAAGGKIIANKWSTAAQPGDVVLMHWDNSTDLHSVLNHAAVFIAQKSATTIQTGDFNGNSARENKYFLRYTSNVAYIIRFPWASSETINSNTSTGVKNTYTGWIWNSAGTKCYHYTDGNLDKNKWMKGTGDWSAYWFYCGADGAAVTNQWQTYNNKYYYLGSEGKALVSSWINYKNNWYYVNDKGNPVTGWTKINNKYYYFTDKGTLVTSRIVTYNGNYYYIGKDGTVVTNTTIMLIADKDGKLTVSSDKA